MISNKLSIVIPVFNEENAVGETIEDVLSIFPECSLILVNDGSTDGTGEVLKKYSEKITVLTHDENRGYGASLKNGISIAQTEFVAIMDADGQHRGSDLKRMWDSHSNEDMITGARDKDSSFPMLRRPGIFFLKMLAEYLAGRKILDLNSGMRIMRKSLIVKYYSILPDSFSFSTTSTLALTKDGYKISYIPITAIKRVGTSTVSIRHGIDTILLIVRLIMLFDPLKIFLPISGLNFLLFLGWAGNEFFHYHRFGSTTVILFMSSLLFFILGLLADQISLLRKSLIK